MPPKGTLWGLLVCLCCSGAIAQTGEIERLASQSQNRKTATLVRPIHGMVLQANYPEQFRPTYEKKGEASYLLELTPAAETVEKWTQMITYQGFKAAAKTASAEKFSHAMAALWQKACPTTYSFRAINQNPVSGFEATAVVLSCGDHAIEGGRTAETTLVVAIAAHERIYVLQWAFRTPPTTGPIKLGDRLWPGLYATLSSVSLCPEDPAERTRAANCRPR